MKSLAKIIKKGGVAVIKTDTLYGLVADAQNQASVDRIYDIKSRSHQKPCIVLIADYHQMRNFGITVDEQLQKKLVHYWPGPVSILMPADDTEVNTYYLHRGTGHIAFRMPDNQELRSLLLETGPLVAPSANPEGKRPASNIDMAMDYFGDEVDYYLDGGEIAPDTKPSKIIKIIHNTDVEIIRE